MPEPPVVDLHKANVVGESPCLRLADDRQRASARAGAVGLPGNVDAPRVEAGFRLGYGKNKPLGDAIAGTRSVEDICTGRGREDQKCYKKEKRLHIDLILGVKGSYQNISATLYTDDTLQLLIL